ncbi:hypothetical protein [Aestuariivirga sp.]|jgi:hypothetical protein|uniref:hypothetical protein n=1 Tax=Aestuariivirga sp. TaxID=2650926 RepID=UPI0037844B84
MKIKSVDTYNFRSRKQLSIDVSSHACLIGQNGVMEPPAPWIMTSSATPAQATCSVNDLPTQDCHLFAT